MEKYSLLKFRNGIVIYNRNTKCVEFNFERHQEAMALAVFEDLLNESL